MNVSIPTSRALLSPRGQRVALPPTAGKRRGMGAATGTPRRPHTAKQSRQYFIHTFFSVPPQLPHSLCPEHPHCPAWRGVLPAAGGHLYPPAATWPPPGGSACALAHPLPITEMQLNPHVGHSYEERLWVSRGSWGMGSTPNSVMSSHSSVSTATASGRSCTIFISCCRSRAARCGTQIECGAWSETPLFIPGSPLNLRIQP